MAIQKETAQVDVQINGEKAGKTLKEIKTDVKQLNAELEQLTPGSEAYNKKLDELKLKQAVLDDHKKAVKGVKDETGTLNEELKKTIPGYGIFQKATGYINDASKAVLGKVQSMSLLGKAFLASGIGLFVVALGALYTYLKQTDDGTKFLQGSLFALQNILGLLTRIVVDLGEKIFNAVTNPKQALKDLVDFLQNNLMNRLKAFGILLDAILNFDGKKAIDGIVQLGTGITDATDKAAKLKDEFGNFVDQIGNAVKEGFDLANLLDDIDAKTRQINVANSENDKIIGRLLLKAKNKAVEDEKSLQLLDRASRLETENLNRKLQLQDMILAAINLEIEAQARKVGMAQVNDDLLNKQAAAIVERNKLEESSLELQEKIANRRAAKEEEIAKKKEAELAKQAALDEKAKADEEKRLEDEKKAQEDRLAQALADIDIEEETKILQRKLWFSQNETDAQQAEDALTEIHRQALNTRLTLLTGDDAKTKSERQKTLNELTKLEIDANNRSTASKKKSVEDQNKLDQARLSAASNTIGGLTSLIADLGGENVKATMGFKALASAEVVLNGIMEVQRIWAGASTLGPILGPIVGGLQTGIAVVRGGLALAKINSVQPKQAKYGAIIQGSSHGANYGEGGIALIDRNTGQEVGEMEGGEPILTAGVTRNPRLLAEASRINIAGGGKPLFAQGGIPSSPSNFTNEQISNAPSELLSLRSDIRELINVMTNSESREVVLYYNKLKEFENDLEVTLKYANP